MDPFSSRSRIFLTFVDLCIVEVCFRTYLTFSYIVGRASFNLSRAKCLREPGQETVRLTVELSCLLTGIRPRDVACTGCLMFFKGRCWAGELSVGKALTT